MQPALVKVTPSYQDMEEYGLGKGWCVVVASARKGDGPSLSVRGASFMKPTRAEAITAAVADVRNTRKQCTCIVPHLTLDECRRAKRAAKNGRQGCIYHRYVDVSGARSHEVVVYPLTFGNTRLCFGEADVVRDGRLREGAIDKSFVYEAGKCELALQAARAWDGTGDPLDGWFRCYHDGRRRLDGDPMKESVRL